MSSIMQNNKNILNPSNYFQINYIALAYKKSLNKDVRRKELLKITMEN